MKDRIPKVVINPKGQHNTKSNEYKIYYLIRMPHSIPKKRVYDSEIKINKKYWTGKENRWVSEKHPTGSVHNAILQKTVAGFLRYQATRKLVGISLNWELIDKYFKVGESGSFNDFVKVYIANRDNFKEHGTFLKYKTFEKYLDEFNSAISFNDINHPFFNQFKNFLIIKKKNSGPTVEKNFDPLKVISKSALLEGYLPIDPFINYKLNVDLTPSEKSKIYLNEDEMIKIRDLKIPDHMPGLKRAHIVFMFSYYLAVRYSDIKILEWEKNIRKSKNGIFVDAFRHKTKVKYLTPLYKFRNGMAILKDQEVLTGGKGYVFRETISGDKYNSHVKKLAELAGIKKDICNTTARKSSLQSWSDHGALEEWLCKVSGHKYKSMLHEHYIQTTINEIASHCEKIDQKRFEI